MISQEGPKKQKAPVRGDGGNPLPPYNKHTGVFPSAFGASAVQKILIQEGFSVLYGPLGHKAAKRWGRGLNQP